MKDAFEFIKSYIQEILTVLLPGSFLLAILIQMQAVESVFYFLYNKIPSEHTDWVPAVIFISIAYFIGHLLMFFGSYLDETVYMYITGTIDKVNLERTFDNLAKIETMRTPGWPNNYWSKYHKLLIITECIRNSNSIVQTKTFGAFKYACSWLQLNKPDVFAIVERRIAESKFFRTMVTAFLVSAFISFIALDTVEAFKPYVYALFFIALAILAFFPYVHLRRKTIEQACEFVIAALGKPIKEVQESESGKK